MELQFALGKYIELTEEKYIQSIDAAKNPAFLKFGLADTAIIETAKNFHLIFTDDRPFYGYLINSQIDAVNLDQIRMI